MSTSYLNFVLVHDTDKTKIFSVNSARHEIRLGVIFWYAPWRQYTIEPEPDTVWNKDCLREVAGFLEQLMVERREATKAGVR